MDTVRQQGGLVAGNVMGPVSLTAKNATDKGWYGKAAPERERRIVVVGGGEVVMSSVVVVMAAGGLQRILPSPIASRVIAVRELVGLSVANVVEMAR